MPCHAPNVLTRTPHWSNSQRRLPTTFRGLFWRSASVPARTRCVARHVLSDNVDPRRRRICGTSTYRSSLFSDDSPLNPRCYPIPPPPPPPFPPSPSRLPRRPCKVCDRHLDLQIDFLFSDDGPLELLSHVGVMSQMTQQLPALIMRYFGEWQREILTPNQPTTTYTTTTTNIKPIPNTKHQILQHTRH